MTKKNDQTALIYIEATQRELEKEQTKMKEKPYNNLTKNEMTSIKELCKQEDCLKRNDTKTSKFLSTTGNT